MRTQAEKAAHFLELHQGPAPLLLPNPWDLGSAKVLASLGFEALATTSGGFAGTLGRLDGTVTKEEAIEHAAAIAAGVDLPVSADLENGFADQPEAVAETLRMAVRAGLAGCSIEDFGPGRHEPIYPLALARDRVAAAAEVAHGGDFHFVLTARAENYLHGHPDLPDTIARLQAYQEAGADVLYAPALTRMADIKAVVSSVDRPVNVLALATVPSVAELAGIGVARISVGSGFARASLAALVDSAAELQSAGTYGFTAVAGRGAEAARRAFAVD
jgi:2-methylisocitrate lyase-like PEP mutase family enzyme